MTPPVVSIAARNQRQPGARSRDDPEPSRHGRLALGSQPLDADAVAKIA